MLTRRISKLLRYSYSRAIFNCRNSSSGNTETDITERDPAPFFFDDEVQTYLKTLTTVDYQKIFRRRLDGHKKEPPQYKFMTDEQLREVQEEARQKAEKYLQMPPVVKARAEITTVLDKDVALLKHDTAKFAFTDVTFGLKDRDRLIVIREPDGTLRHANWQERDRLIESYFPKHGREIRKPKMFEGEHLKSLLNRGEYEFILDRACVQFEPNDPDYKAITQEVYEHINWEKHFDALRSTRHFGPMVFHLVWTSTIENLLCKMIEAERMKDAVLLIRLYHKIHPTAESAVAPCENQSSDEEFIMHYARLDSPNPTMIEKFVQSYKEMHQKRQSLETIKTAQAAVLKMNMAKAETDKAETDKTETNKVETDKAEMDKV